MQQSQNYMFAKQSLTTVFWEVLCSEVQLGPLQHWIASEVLPTKKEWNGMEWNGVEWILVEYDYFKTCWPAQPADGCFFQ